MKYVLIVATLFVVASMACAANDKPTDVVDTFVNASFAARYKIRLQTADGGLLEGTADWYHDTNARQRIDLAYADDKGQHRVTTIKSEDSTICYGSGLKPLDCVRNPSLWYLIFRDPKSYVFLKEQSLAKRRNIGGVIAECIDAESLEDECFDDDGIPILSTGITARSVAVMLTISRTSDELTADARIVNGGHATLERMDILALPEDIFRPPSEVTDLLSRE